MFRDAYRENVSKSKNLLSVQIFTNSVMEKINSGLFINVVQYIAVRMSKLSIWNKF